MKNEKSVHNFLLIHRLKSFTAKEIHEQLNIPLRSVERALKLLLATGKIGNRFGPYYAELDTVKVMASVLNKGKRRFDAMVEKEARSLLNHKGIDAELTSIRADHSRENVETFYEPNANALVDVAEKMIAEYHADST